MKNSFKEEQDEEIRREEVERLKELFEDWDESEIETKLHTKFHIIDDVSKSTSYGRLK